jgi:photosynthetic reaction center H subunit
MWTGAITGYIDVAQVVLYVFWAFFAGLILYLHREGKREGYPLESDRSRFITVQGFPATPPPKRFKLADGRTVQSGRVDERALHAQPVAAWPGAPLTPTGDPMRDGVGPAAYALRADEPERTSEGLPLIAPIGLVADTTVATEDVDPRGMPVIAGDRQVAGTVSDLWVDRSEPQIRYLQVAVDGVDRPVLLPINFARIRPRRGVVEVDAIFARHFKDVPPIKHADHITKLEEDMITAYYAGGTLYATPARTEPLL